MPKSSNLFKKLFKPTKSKKDAQEIVAEQGPRKFSFKTLSSATEGFHAKNKLGKGGFAQVYKGKLNDGREIAVKRPLQISDKGKELVLNELKLLLGSAHHRNIVKFLGFCSHREEMLLVFEFASNGSLDHLLFNSEAGRADALDWKRTYAIIIGVARALLYLHEQSHSVIIHCDIKPANILIDENWVPKIADFGTARLFPQDQTGYAAPEYQNYGHISPEADTYSFGVVVLELISGQKYWLSHARSSNAQGLRDSANELYKEGKVSQFMDRKLIPSAVLDQVQLCIQIGVMCTQFDLELRPTMGRVYSMLSENYSSSSSTLVEEPMRDGSSSSSSSSTARISGRKELSNNGSSSETDIHLENEGLPIHRRLTRSRRIQPEDVQSYIPSISGSSYSSIGPTQLANNGSSSGADIHLENKSLPKHHRLTRSRRIQLEDVQSYIPSIPSSSCSSSGNGIQIEPNEGPVRATIQEVAAAAEEEDEEGIPIPMITKEDPIETLGKLCPRKTSARQSRKKTPLPPPHMTKQTKEATKKVAKQQQTVEEEADEKSPTTLNDTEERPINLTPEDTIVPEIKVDKERLAANDAKDFWQAITKLKSLETSFKKSLNDEGNKSSWCKEGFFEEGEEGKYKDQLTNPQDAIFTNNWEGILRKVGVAEDSLLLSEVPLSGLVEQQPSTAKEAVDNGDHGGGSVADSNG